MQPLDATFVFMVLNIIAGLYVIYKCARHYQLLKSVDYLAVGFYFFSLTLFVAFRIWAYFGYYFEWAGARDPRFFQHYGLPLIIVDAIWGLGFIAILFHVFRLIDWNHRHPVIKVTVLLLAIEGVLEAVFHYSIWAIQIYINQDFGQWTGVDTTLAYPLTNLWFFHLIPFFSPLAGMQLYLALQSLLVALAYATAKPVTASREITAAKAAWVIFGVVVAARWLLLMPLWINLPFFQENRAFFSLFDGAAAGSEFLEFLATAALMVIVAVYPEALLITEYQVAKARKLYRFLEKEAAQARGPHVLDTEKRLADYLQRLPPELLESLHQ